MEKKYHKLVRDRIPDIIRESGNECETAVLSDEEYRQALRQKLIEEAAEVAAADEDDLVAELADLSEVMDAVMISFGISGDRLLAEKTKRREARGGFTQKIMLLRTFSKLSALICVYLPHICGSFINK